MTQVALLLTVAFIAYCLRNDLRQGERFSVGAWISFIWIALSISKPLVFWLHPGLIQFGDRADWAQGNVRAIQNDPLQRNLLVALILLGLITLVGRSQVFKFPALENRWLIVFIAYCLLSVFWTGFPNVVVTRWIRLAGDIIAISLVLTERYPEETTYRIIRRVTLLFLPLSILFIHFYSQLGRVYTSYGFQMWVGVTGHKNQLGVLCAFTGIVLVWWNVINWPKINRIDGGLLMMATYLLIGSRSATSAIVLLLGVFLLVAQSFLGKDIRKLSRIVLIGIGFLLVIQVLAVSFLNQSLTPIFFSAAGRDSSFTGRVPIWQELIKMGLRTPFMGHGFDSFWVDSSRVAEAWERIPSLPTSAHNGYVEIFLNLGIVGLLIVFAIFAQAYKNIIRSDGGSPALSKLKFVLLIMVLSHNFTESTLAKPNTLTWLLFLLSSIVIRPKSSTETRAGIWPTA